VDSAVRDLFRAALEKTESGALRWTAFDPEAFWTKVPPGRIHIQRVPADAAPVPTFDAQVTDAVGRIEAEVSESEGSADFALLNELFRAVEVSVPKRGRVLEEMLQTLKTSA
jgi:hypothetical protein